MEVCDLHPVSHEMGFVRLSIAWENQMQFTHILGNLKRRNEISLKTGLQCHSHPNEYGIKKEHCQMKVTFTFCWSLDVTFQQISSRYAMLFTSCLQWNDVVRLPCR